MGILRPAPPFTPHAGAAPPTPAVCSLGVNPVGAARVRSGRGWRLGGPAQVRVSGGLVRAVCSASGGAARSGWSCCSRGLHGCTSRMRACDRGLEGFRPMLYQRQSPVPIAAQRRMLQKNARGAKLCTLSPPTSSAACEAGEATTCTLSVAHEMGATRRSSGECSACTSPIFRSFYQFVKLAAHA